jgi:AraC-like DNA-binding protein/quercetin dioxygenase-like cupin family protein
MIRMRQGSPSSCRSGEGAQIRTFAVRYSTGTVLPEHKHGWHQLVYASEGVMSVHTPRGAWVVPPQRAVWIPGGMSHKVEMHGSVSMRSLYVEPSLARALPADCCVVNVSPLLRELILHAVKLGTLDLNVPNQGRIIGVILDELGALPVIPLLLPVPRDPRALRVAEQVRQNPSEQCSLEEISRAAGASKRTIERLFIAQTGMSFGRWRQQARLLHALRLLAVGESVTAVALEVGYDSTSAFISMFKKTFGTSPSRYRVGATY